MFLSTLHLWPRYAANIQTSVKLMNQLYDELTKLQGDAYTCKKGSHESCA